MRARVGSLHSLTCKYIIHTHTLADIIHALPCPRAGGARTRRGQAGARASQGSRHARALAHRVAHFPFPRANGPRACSQAPSMSLRYYRLLLRGTGWGPAACAGSLEKGAACAFNGVSNSLECKFTWARVRRRVRERERERAVRRHELFNDYWLLNYQSMIIGNLLVPRQRCRCVLCTRRACFLVCIRD